MSNKPGRPKGSRTKRKLLEEAGLDTRMLSQALATPDDIVSVRNRALNDLFFLSKYIIGFKDFTTIHQKLVYKISEPFKHKIRMFLLPRGFFKTSLITVAHTVWQLINNPNLRILICSATFVNACKMITEIGNIFLRNPVIKALFPDWCPKNSKDPESKWTESVIALPNKTSVTMEGNLEAMGIDSTITSRHYDMIIFDDIVNDLNSMTPDMRLKVLNFFKAALSLRDNPSVPIIICGTRWHIHDLYGLIESAWDGVDTILVPAIVDNESTFPERYPMNELENIKQKQGEYLFSCLYMLNPLPEELQVFKPDDIQFYHWGKYNPETKIKDIIADDHIIPIRKCWMGVDPAVTEHSGDYSAIVIVTTDDENNIYVVDSWRQKCSPMDLMDIIIAKCSEWPVIKVNIESFVFQEMLIQYLNEKQRREKLHLPSIEGIKSTKQSWMVRIRSMQPFVASQCVYLHKLHNDLFIELTSFPQGRTRDLLDALYYSMRNLQPASRKKEIKPYVLTYESIINKSRKRFKTLGTVDYKFPELQTELDIMRSL